MEAVVSAEWQPGDGKVGATMFDIIEGTHVITDGIGYGGLRAAQYAKEHGLTLVVMTPPETWEEAEANEQAW